MRGGKASLLLLTLRDDSVGLAKHDLPIQVERRRGDEH